MTPLRQRFIDDLQLRKRSPKTVSAYVFHVRNFARHAEINRYGRSMVRASRRSRWDLSAARYPQVFADSAGTDP